MHVSVDEVYEKRFSKVRKGGYDPDEVEHFLNDVYLSYKAMAEENEQTQGQNRSLKLRNDELEQQMAHLQMTQTARNPAAEEELARIKMQLEQEVALREQIQEQLGAMQARCADLEMEAGELRQNAQCVQTWDITAEIEAQHKAAQFLEKTRSDAGMILEEAQHSIRTALDGAKAQLQLVRERLSEHTQTMLSIHEGIEAFWQSQGAASEKILADMTTVTEVSDMVDRISAELESAPCFEMLTVPQAPAKLRKTPARARTTKTASAKTAES